jgi:hypothetical protein
MKLKAVYKAFQKAADERVWEEGFHDYHGFERLLRLGVVGSGDILSSAEHDQVWLNVEMKKFASVATIDDINYLVDCGIHADEDYDSLYMFV